LRACHELGMKGPALNLLMKILAPNFVVTNRLRDEFPEIKIIAYADDVVLLNKSLMYLQDAGRRFEVLSKEMHLHINYDKTKVMKFRRGGKLASYDVLTLGDEVPIEFVGDFSYLGIVVTTTLRSCTKHVDARIAKASAAAATIRGADLLSIHCALSLYDLKVQPILSYGLNLWWDYVTQDHLRKIDSVKSGFLKRALCVAKGTRSRMVLMLCECESGASAIRKSLNLAKTPYFEQYEEELLEKMLEVDLDFYNTPAMINSEWRLARCKDRHAVTRHAVHGFHFECCSVRSFHDPCESCYCRWCEEKCSRYHLLQCFFRPTSIHAFVKMVGGKSLTDD
jgi:hypothetical protein